MVTEKFAQKQIRRFAVYGDYPRLRDEKVLPELRRALVNSGNTDERAERIVDAILAEPAREFCPKPGEIQAVARETDEYPPKGGLGCPLCRGTDNLAPPGFIRVSIHGQGTVTMCKCHPGRLSAQPRGAGRRFAGAGRKAVTA